MTLLRCSCLYSRSHRVSPPTSEGHSADFTHQSVFTGLTGQQRTKSDESQLSKGVGLQVADWTPVLTSIIPCIKVKWSCFSKNSFIFNQQWWRNNLNTACICQNTFAKKWCMSVRGHFFNTVTLHVSFCTKNVPFRSKLDISPNNCVLPHI